MRLTIIDALAISVMAMLGGSALALIVTGKVLGERRLTDIAQIIAGVLALLVCILAVADWLG